MTPEQEQLMKDLSPDSPVGSIGTFEAYALLLAMREEIERLRSLCDRSFDQLNMAVGESWAVHDRVDVGLLNDLMVISQTAQAARQAGKDKP